MADEHGHETKDAKPYIDPKPLGKPESLKEVIHDVLEGAAEFLEGHPPHGATDAGHVEGANEE